MDFEPQTFIGPLENHPHTRRSRVTRNIGGGFLRYAEQRDRDFGRHVIVHIVQLRYHFHTRALPELADVAVNHLAQTHALRKAGMQLLRDVAHRLCRRCQLLLHRMEPLLNRRSFAERQSILQPADIQVQRCDGLAEIIMDFARDTTSLLLDPRFRPVRQRAQLVA